MSIANYDIAMIIPHIDLVFRVLNEFFGFHYAVCLKKHCVAGPSHKESVKRLYSRQPKDKERLVEGSRVLWTSRSRVCEDRISILCHVVHYRKC